ncbi:DEAD/DEAH box helicase [candidate division KSB1 bacterium]|nr:DEAD/DEAH box helicase [candidate division KSB1 bacterium]
MKNSSSTNNFSNFHPIIQQWFSETFEAPTPAQIKGWNSIANGESTLILAPTGSGKTLAAFLVCINSLLEKFMVNDIPKKVHTLYISPLKALNYDIERNLEKPLNGIQKKASLSGLKLPKIQVAVRTGDTTQKERQQMLKAPPQILITTPESLHLLLTSVKAQHILTEIRYVIIDEIHALSENKRGTFLTILLERLQHIVEKQFIRIGLSATQKPLDIIAKFLAGAELKIEGDKVNLIPRNVKIVDAGIRKQLDVQIISPVSDFTELPEETIWPDIYRKLLDLIQQHKSTLIFANNRAAVERITSEINERAGYELASAHHGSVSKQKRREIENQLKQGMLKALVATATLELGIDMGSIDLVCQVESPKSVARGLQRVGRAGHLYKSASKGRLIPKMRYDLLEMTAITAAMYNGDVSPIKIPRNCLDILAQQIVAMVSLKSWALDALFNFVRQAYPYRELPRAHFLGVVEMLSGRYPSDAFRDLKARISWDRVNNILYALPGSQRVAILSGGAIPDTGQYPVYLENKKTKIGELEEEFIFERRIGDTFTLGTSNWKIKEITHDRVIAVPAPGEVAQTPFWKGEFSYRNAHLSKYVGSICREIAEKLEQPECQYWLQKNYHLNADAAFNIIQFLKSQIQTTGTIPTDKIVVIESFYDEMGDFRVSVLSPFGGHIHFPWTLAILAQFRKQLNIEPESLHSDIGFVFRYPVENINLIINTIRTVTSNNVEDLIIEELANSQYFGLRFRHNANRAMLIPRPKPGKRAPLWLQRMRSRELLEITTQYPSFPIVIETYRECLQDLLAIDDLKHILQQIENDEIKIIVRQNQQASPFSASLMFQFMMGYMYEYEKPKAERDTATVIDKSFLLELIKPNSISDFFDEQAIIEFDKKLQFEMDGYKIRTANELVEVMHRIGELTDDEISQKVAVDVQPIIQELCDQNRILKIYIPNVINPWRWIAAEDFPLYRAAFQNPGVLLDAPESYQKVFQNSDQLIAVEQILPEHILSQCMNREQAQKEIITKFLYNHALMPFESIKKRYNFDEQFAQNVLQQLEDANVILKITPQKANSQAQWGFHENVKRIRKITLKQQRKSVQINDTNHLTNFLLYWQHISAQSKLKTFDGLITVIEQLQGLSLPAEIWENEIFSKRIDDYKPEWLDQLCRQGDVVWFGTASGGRELGNITFAFREDLPKFLALKQINTSNETNENMLLIREVLQKKGALFLNDIAIEANLLPSICINTLWKMIWTGEVTNDTFAVIRAGKPQTTTSHMSYFSQSSLTAKGLRQSKYSKRYRPSTYFGRWNLLPTPNSINETYTEQLTRQLLNRYGLICREIFEIEQWQISWHNIYDMLIKLEWRGEIRRGYFIKGLSGVQFALPHAAELLMGSIPPIEKKLYTEDNDRMILINTCDPVNLFGAASPVSIMHPLNSQWRLLRNPGNYIIFQNGSPVFAIEAKGSRLSTLKKLTHSEKLAVLNLLPKLLDDPAGLRRIRSVKIEYWNDQPVRNSEIFDDLKKLGFQDDYKAMVFNRLI